MGQLSGPAAFADDDGSVPAELAELLARHAGGQAAWAEVVMGLAGHRLLVPLLEVDADQLEVDGADPCAGRDRAMAAVSVRTDRGTVGLAFTGMAPLLAWDSRARPLPVDAPRVAAALLAEDGIALVVDPAGPVPCRVEGLALARLAAGGAWPEPWLDPVVRQAVAAELGPVLASGEVQLRLAPGSEVPGPAVGSQVAGQSPGLAVEIRFPGGLAPEVQAERLAIIARRLSGSSALRQAYEGVLAVLPLDGDAGPADRVSR